MDTDKEKKEALKRVKKCAKTVFLGLIALDDEKQIDLMDTKMPYGELANICKKLAPIS